MIGKKITNNKLFYGWYGCWACITPLLLLALVVLKFRRMEPIELNGYSFPYWTHIVGHLISASTLLGIFLWAIYALIDVLFIHKKVFFRNETLFIYLVEYFKNMFCY